MKQRAAKLMTMTLTLLVLMSMSLAGCGTGTKAPEKDSSKTTDSGQKTEAKAEGGLSGKLELQIFTGGYGNAFWNEVIEGYKKEYPNVEIVTNMGPKINEAMKTRWISNNPPDIVYVDGPEMPQAFPLLASEGKFMDLKPWFDTAKRADGSELIKDNLIKGVVKEDQGKIYQAPYIFNTWGIWYEQKLLSDYGLTPPTNYEEFLKVGEALKEKKVAALAYTGVYPLYLFRGAVLQGVASEGGQQLLDDVMDLKPGVFKSDGFRKTIEKIKTLVDHKLIMDGTVALNHTQSQMEWLNRKAAFIPVGLWLESEMKKDIPADFAMKFVPSLLQDAGKKMVVLPDSFGLAVSSQTKNPEAAKAFLEYLYRDTVVKRFIELTGTPSVYNVDASALNISEATMSVQKWLSDPNVEFLTKKKTDVTPEVETEISNGLNALVLGKITVDELCERAEKAAEKARSSKQP